MAVKRLRAYWRRLNGDFQLSIITLLGLLGVVGITPFAVYRFLRGEWLVGLIDSAAVLGILLGIAYGWRTGRLVGLGWFLSILINAVSVAVAILYGVFGLYWVYSTLLATFFLIGVRSAWLIASVVVVLLFVTNESFGSNAERWSFVVTAFMMCCFAATFAIRSRLQHALLLELATIDALTGIANRRSLDEEMHILVADAERHDKRPGLLLMDLDFFKRVNDTHGHDVGDDVLKRFVDLILAQTRASDRLFRFGGEEFVLLVGDSKRESLSYQAEKLRYVVENSLAVKGESITVSIGMALWLPGEAAEAWLRRADQALYQAKGGGRNRCVFSEGE